MILCLSLARNILVKVEKILKRSMGLIPSVSMSCEHLNFLFLWFFAKHCWVMSSNVLPIDLKSTCPPVIWIFTEGEGDGIESRLSSKIYIFYFKSNLIILVTLMMTVIEMSQGDRIYHWTVWGILKSTWDILIRKNRPTIIACHYIILMPWFVVFLMAF